MRKETSIRGKQGMVFFAFVIIGYDDVVVVCM